MKDKNKEEKLVSGKQPCVGSDPKNISPPQVKSHNSAEEQKSTAMDSKHKDSAEGSNKVEGTKVDRPFRSRLPKLKMFIPRRPKSSSRNRNEDTKTKMTHASRSNYSPKPSPKSNRTTMQKSKSKQSPKPTQRKFGTSELQKSRIKNSPTTSPKFTKQSPIKRGSKAESPIVARKKSPGLRRSPNTQCNSPRRAAIITSASRVSPVLSPAATVKHQKDLENEKEKLRIINDILIASLPSGTHNVSNNKNPQKNVTSSRPSKIPVYQNIHLYNRYPNEVS